MKQNRAIIFLSLAFFWAIVSLVGVGESGLTSSSIVRLFAGGMASGAALTLAIKTWRQPQ